MLGIYILCIIATIAILSYLIISLLKSKNPKERTSNIVKLLILIGSLFFAGLLISKTNQQRVTPGRVRDNPAYQHIEEHPEILYQTTRYEPYYLNMTGLLEEERKTTQKRIDEGIKKIANSINNL